MPYNKAQKAAYYDCDVNNRLKLSAAMKYMQQTSGEHLEHIGLPYEKLYKENLVFLLSKMCIKIHNMPSAGQNLSIRTAATETRGVRFVREFAIDCADTGEHLVSAVSLWVLVNPVSRKVLRPGNFPYELPFVKSLVHGEIDDYDIPKMLDEAQSLQTQIKVGYSHIDSNSHVTNSEYANFIADAIPYDQMQARPMDTVIISFQNEAKWGSTINIRTSELSALEYYIRGAHDSGACFEAYVKMSDKVLASWAE